MSPQVQAYFHAATGTWSYIVADPPSRAAAIIDPVLDFDPASGRVSTGSAQGLVGYVREHALHVEWILETHAHADHLTAADWLKRTLGADTGTPVRTGIGCGIVAVQRHFKQALDLGPEFATDGSQFDRLLQDNEGLRLGTLEVRVIATPGHTSDGVSYLIGDSVFVGDTLFAPAAGTGRCDFPGADPATQFRSIQRLYALPDATRVFLCHDYPVASAQPQAQSTIAAQKSTNVQVRSDTTEDAYVALRTRRDATLALPQLLYPSIQVNICAGRLPAPAANGCAYLKLPLRPDCGF